MKSSTSKKIEKNIYEEFRSGSHRFTVAVYPLEKETRTVPPDEYHIGLQWARGRRVELLGQKLANKTGLPQAVTVAPSSAFNLVTQGGPTRPDAIRLQDIFDAYRATELSKLAGEDAQTCRLKKLEEWFGHLSLGEVDYDRIEHWKARRLSGILGSGRNPNRGTAPEEQLKTKAERQSEEKSGSKRNDEEVAKKPLTKHQKHWRKTQAIKDGIKIPETFVFPVSTQTVRHELVLLKRAIKAYFLSRNLMLAHGGWLQSHHVLVMELPAKSEPRDRRLSNDEIQAIMAQFESTELKSAILFALLTTLRRSELMSLRWENVDFSKCVVRLLKPGHQKKTKTTTRDVPLLPGAIILLQDLGPKKTGLIIPYAPASFSQAWRRAADRAGVFDARLHDCRREAISRLIETCNLELASVAAFSGHADLATLHKYYVRISPAALAVKIAQIPGSATMMPSL